MERLEVQSFGPIGKVSIEFGDLTLLIGPQASGKSIFLQLLKLLVDKKHILYTLNHVLHSCPAYFEHCRRAA